MPRAKKAPTCEVMSRSREVREQAAARQRWPFAGAGAYPINREKASDLCRRRHELLDKSRELRDRLRELCDAC